MVHWESLHQLKGENIIIPSIKYMKSSFSSDKIASVTRRPPALYTWCKMHKCAVHRDIKNVCWERSWCRPNFGYHKSPSFLLYYQIKKQTCMVPTFYRPGMTTAQTPTEPSSCGGNNVNFMRVQPHYSRVWKMEPRHQIDEIARLSSYAIEPLALCHDNNNANSSMNVVVIWNVRDWCLRGTHVR